MEQATCSVDGCEAPAKYKAKRLCSKHYMRSYQRPQSEGTCSEDGCEADLHANGRCKKHYSAWYRQQNAEKYEAYKAQRRKPSLAPRTCVVCEQEFTPNAASQQTCPPSSVDKAGRKHPNRAQSWCAKRYYRFKQGEIEPLRATPPGSRPDSFECVGCGKKTVPGRNGVHITATKFCSKQCKGAWHQKQNPWHPPKAKRGPCCRVKRQIERSWIEGQCPECGDRFVRKDNHHLALGYCSRKCQKRVSRRRRRAYKKGAGYKTLTYWSIAERDRWTCQLCGKPIDTTAAFPDRNCPTLDHIVPLSRGGEHSIENVQLAHFICNSTKSDGMAVSVGGQMSLV